MAGGRGSGQVPRTAGSGDIMDLGQAWGRFKGLAPEAKVCSKLKERQA